MQRFTADQVSAALLEARGIKRDAARLLGCARTTVENYIRRYESVRDALIQARAGLVDDAMGQLGAAVDRGDWQAVSFTLSTLGKSMGFGRHDDPPAAGDPAGERKALLAEFEAALAKVYGPQARLDLAENGADADA